MSLTTVLGITVLGHHRVNRSLRTSANLDFVQPKLFRSPRQDDHYCLDCAGFVTQIPARCRSSAPSLTVLSRIPVRAGKPPRQRAIAQRFRALAPNRPMSALVPLSVEKRPHLGHCETDAVDPLRPRPLR